MNAYVRKLLELFMEGITLLSEHNVKWSEYMKDLKNKLEKCNGKNEILAFLVNNENNIFGGMGSLFDIYISEKNGHIAKDFGQANKTLDEYRHRFYSEWMKIKEEIGSLK